MMTATRDPPVLRMGTGDWSSQAVGGKAAALSRLAELGFPVPPSMAVPASVYQSVLHDPRVAAILERLHAGDAVDEAVIDDAFLHAVLPEPLVEELTAAGRALRRASTIGKLAVRSSATAEDTSAASFAGQYRSYLDVGSDEALLRAIRLVWASLWRPTAREYRHLFGVDEERIAMAVLLMAQVDAQTSGVVFTIDPSGTSATRIEMVEGLADQLVSGDVTPSVHLLHKGATGDRCPPAVLVAAKLAWSIEAALGMAQDVEWAFDGDRVFVVQARPITTSSQPEQDPFDDVLDPMTTYTTAGVGEMLPGPLAPLSWTVAAQLQEEALRELLAAANADLGSSAAAGPLLRRVRGHAVLDFDALSALAESSRGGAAQELAEAYFGPAEAPALTRRRGRRHARSGQMRLLRQRHRLLAESTIVEAAVDHVLDARVPIAALGDAELLAYRARLLGLGGRAVTAEALVAAAAASSYGDLQALLSKWLDSAAASRAAQQLTAGATALAGTLNGVNLSGDDALRRAGSRAFFAGPTWEEEPVTVGGARATTNPSPWRTEREQIVQQLQRRPAWRRTRVLTGQIVDVRIHLLRRLAADARQWLARREAVKAAVLRLGGEVRRLHQEAGRRLARRGVLREPSDVELLTSTELARALVDAATPALELANRRRAFARASVTDVPASFVGTPSSPLAAVQAGGDVLHGWAAGPGRADGTARVVCDPVHDEFAPGDVLVAPATDASWLPLFAHAAAVVVERGGPLSHAAICARELGVPAVVNVPGVCDRISGLGRPRVAVDGDAGTVALATRSPAGPPVGDDSPVLPPPVMGPSRVLGPSVEALDDVEAASMNVFVPAIMSLGVIFSLGSLLIDAMRAVVPSAGRRRRVVLQARATASEVLEGLAGEELGLAGRRSRVTYTALTAAFSAFAVYLVVGQSANYLRRHDYLDGIAWLWALSLVVSVVALVAAWSCALTAATFDRPGFWVRWMLAATPLGRRPRDAGS